MELKYYILIYFVALVAKCFWHGLVWRQKGFIASIHKMAGNALKGFLWACLATFWYKQYIFTWGEVFPAMVGSVTLQAAIWWLLFDLGVNVVGGKPLFHLGESAATDRYFNDYPTKLIFQLLLLIASAIGLALLDARI